MQKEFIEQIFRIIPSGLFTVDINQRITSWNKRSEEIAGYSVEEVIGKKCTVFTEHPCKERCGVFSEKIKKPIINKECTIKRKDGQFRIILKNADLIRNKDRDIVGAIESFEDITDRKKAEAILKRDKEGLDRLIKDRTKELVKTHKELNNAKRLSDIGALASTVAHELRNPLAAIRTAAYNIRQKKQGMAIDGNIANIEKKVLEADQIINNLLFYSHIRVPRFEKMKWCDILDDCIATSKARFPEHKVTIRKICKGPKSSLIEADPLQIREVFSNILINAYQSFHRKSGKIVVEGWFDKHKNFKISFKDNGGGIRRDYLNRLFEPFFSTKSNGTGLGLVVCNQMVNLHDGKIEVDSKPGKGTTISITLPQAPK